MKLPLLLGIGALGYLALGTKKAHAGGHTTAAPTNKEKKRAEWLAAIAHAKGQSYEQYVKVLNAAYKTGLFSQDEISRLQKAHRDFPKADAPARPGAATPVSVGPTVGERVRDALATNNASVIRMLANDIASSHPDLAADLREAADRLDGMVSAGQAQAESQSPGLPPPVTPTVATASPSPKPASKPRKPASKPAAGKPRKPAPAPVTYDPEVHGPSDDNRERAIALARHLTMAKKGSEDRALVEAFQRQENRIRVAAGKPEGISPDGKYGIDTALALEFYGLVPPKPMYWGKGGSWQSMQDEKARWKSHCADQASRDSARQAEWLSASKV